MEEIRNRKPVYEKPELQMIPLDETDVIRTSGEPSGFEDEEGEIIPFHGFEN